MTQAHFRVTIDVTPEQSDQVADVSVVKAIDEQRYMLTVAYPANKADVAVAQDGHIDFAPPDVIEKAAWNFVRKGAKLGMWHEDGHDDAAVCVESYIYRGPDWAIDATDGTTQVIKAGDWLLGVICSEPTWDLYKQGQIGGVSPQGAARRRVPTAEALAGRRS